MALRRATRTGRPLGRARFVNRLERLLGRSVQPQKRGPKKRSHWKWQKNQE